MHVKGMRVVNFYICNTLIRLCFILRSLEKAKIRNLTKNYQFLVILIARKL